MAPQVVLVRHAQAEHNLSNTCPVPPPRHAPADARAQDYSLPDPPLTADGMAQCEALREALRARLAGVPRADVAVVVSPMRRTLHTAALALGWLGVPLEADPDWQETTAKPCDTGSPLAALARAAPPGVAVDWARVAACALWPDKTSTAAARARFGPTRGIVLARCAAALAALHRRRERLVVVVSHSGFLRAGVCGWWFANADYRVFDFAPGDEAALIQHPDTLAGGLGLSWTESVELGAGLPESDDEEHDGDGAAAAYV